MKRQLTGIICMILLATPVFAEKKIELKTKKDKLSYSLGYNMANNLKRDGLEADPDIVARAMKDVFSDGKALMTEQEMKETMMAVQQEMQAKQQEKMKAQAEKNKKEGEAFLAENKKKEGVVTLPNGLQYKVITEGKGKSPKATDKVTVNYRGTLIEGTEFDSSYKRGQPATFTLNQVIKGWTEGLQLMKEGGKMTLFVPSELGYGDRGAGPVIGPGATLIFEVELISVGQQEKKEPDKGPEKKEPGK